MHLCKRVFDATLAVAIAASVAAAGATAGTVIQSAAAKKRSRLERARAALAERRETLKTVREAQALKAVAANTADAQGASDSSPLTGGLQGVNAQAESNLAYIRSQGNINRAEAKVDNLAFLGSTISAGSGLLGSAAQAGQSEEGKRVLGKIFGT